jgi:hypothetical protein
MRRTLAILALLLPASLAAQSPDSTLAPLDSVVAQVQHALARYQATLGTGPDALPPLKSAVFDFKTTVAKTGAFSVNLLILTIGASSQSDVVNDVTFAYAVPRASTRDIRKFAAAPDVEDQLFETIQGAARAVRSGAGTVGEAAFSQLTVTLQYGVRWEASGGARPRLAIVTVGLKADRTDNRVQTIKLVFAR